MDEAEYCGRLGIMNLGRLLAMDSPALLKRDLLPGPAWNVTVDQLIPALEALQRFPGVYQAGLRGDHLRAITLAGSHESRSLQSALQGLGFTVQVEPADPTLEDVFMALAGCGAESAV
jgi:ABC-2 type transport system ATP-binding protein